MQPWPPTPCNQLLARILLSSRWLASRSMLRSTLHGSIRWPRWQFFPSLLRKADRPGKAMGADAAESKVIQGAEAPAPSERQKQKLFAACQGTVIAVTV